MIKNISRISNILLFFILIMLITGETTYAQMQTKKTSPIETKTVVSRVVKIASGKSYIEVDGKPFLYNSVQSWYPPEQDYSLYVQKAAEAGYRCITFWLYWNHIEPEEEAYDWSELDKVINLANKYDVRLDIVWAGTNFCDHLDPRFAPKWILNRHKYHLKDSNGRCAIARGFDQGNCCAVEPTNEKIFSKEKNVLIKMLEHLKQYDQNHRTIAIQIQNEPNINGYQGGKNNVLAYINALGRAVKESDYIIVTRVNLAFKSMDSEIDALQYIDGHGPDTYDERVALTRNLIRNDKNNTKFKYIAENSAWCNTTSHIVAALVNGGFYNIYRLDYDAIWNKPGLYDRNFKPWMVTKEVTQLNSALNKIGSVIASAPKQNMLEFNTEWGYPTIWYDEKKTLANRVIGFKCRNGSEPVGLVVEKDGNFYCIADNMAYFTFDSEPTICETGRYNSDGNWQTDKEKSWTKLTDDIFQISYGVGECLRIRD